MGAAINLLAQKHPINSALSLIVVMGSLALLGSLAAIGAGCLQCRPTDHREDPRDLARGRSGNLPVQGANARIDEEDLMAHPGSVVFRPAGFGGAG